MSRIKFILPLILTGCTVLLTTLLQYTLAYIFFLALGIIFFLLFNKKILDEEDEPAAAFAGVARIEGPMKFTGCIMAMNCVSAKRPAEIPAPPLQHNLRLPAGVYAGISR